MRYGRSVPEGSIPVFSVDTEEEAKSLLTLACPTRFIDGVTEYVAPELATEQTLENLEAFSDRLAKTAAMIETKRGTA